jgi:hypothetical protein
MVSLSMEKPAILEFWDKNDVENKLIDITNTSTKLPKFP